MFRVGGGWARIGTAGGKNKTTCAECHRQIDFDATTFKAVYADNTTANASRLDELEHTKKSAYHVTKENRRKALVELRNQKIAGLRRTGDLRSRAAAILSHANRHVMHTLTPDDRAIIEAVSNTPSTTQCKTMAVEPSLHATLTPHVGAPSVGAAKLTNQESILPYATWDCVCVCVCVCVCASVCFRRWSGCPGRRSRSTLPR